MGICRQELAHAFSYKYLQLPPLNAPVCVPNKNLTDELAKRHFYVGERTNLIAKLFGIIREIIKCPLIENHCRNLE